MSNLITTTFEQTSSGGSIMHTQVARIPVIVPVFPAFPETASHEPVHDWDLLLISERTTSGFTLPPQPIDSAQGNQNALNEIKKLSGLTWEQLAKLFNVSRRSLHFWASGQPLSPFNEKSLNRLLLTVQHINRGSASINHRILLNPTSDNKIPFDLLVAGRHEDVKKLLGPGNAAQRPQLVPLSPDASTSRLPHKPEELVDILHASIHREVGRSRPVRAVRSRQGGSRQ